jgi:methanogenic corrinoid protein MtbC1
MSGIGQRQVTLTEVEESLRELTAAILAGTVDEAKQRAYTALAKGNRENEILEAIVEAVNIIFDLEELEQYDQAKTASVENAVNSCLQILEEWLTKSEGKFDVKIAVGPVGLKAGALSSLILSASLRSAGFRSTSLEKTQTALDLLRNSEELGVDLVIPILSGNGDEDLRDFTEAYERGGFKNKFEIIPIVPGASQDSSVGLAIARNSGEAISIATQWALKNGRV